MCLLAICIHSLVRCLFKSFVFLNLCVCVVLDIEPMLAMNSSLRSTYSQYSFPPSLTPSHPFLRQGLIIYPWHVAQAGLTEIRLPLLSER